MCMFYITSEYRDKDKLQVIRAYPMAEPVIYNSLRSALLELMNLLLSFIVELSVSNRFIVLHKNYFLFLSS